MAKIEFFSLNGADPVPSSDDEPRCLCCGAREGESHGACPSPYKVFSASKTRTIHDPDVVRPKPHE